MTETKLLSDLKDLRDEWEWEVETYIDSPVESERTMSAQQYTNLKQLEELIEKHDPDT